MVLGFGLLAVSAVMLIAGAELFTENAGAAARGLRITVFGAAFLLAGAEPEEMITAVIASGRHRPGLAAGDAIGANLTMLTLVLGLAALAAAGGIIGRWQGGLLVAAYLAGVALLWWRERKPPAIGEVAEAAAGDGGSRPAAAGLALALGGVALMAAGGWLAVGGAERVVAAARLTDTAVGLTLLALATTAELFALAGTQATPRALQPPVSFRVSGQVLAHLDRAVTMLDAAVSRALEGITDSPAYVEQEDGSGRFLGTAGFHGYDLAAHLHILTVAVIGAAELGATRLHRMLDPKTTGLNAQLSPDPGPHTGLSPVHKRAVGVVHALRRLAVPSTVGTMETSAGQEDAQTFSAEAAEDCRLAGEGLREVLACELLAVHQAQGLGAQLPRDAERLAGALDAAAAVLPSGTEDRFFGQDVTRLVELLARGWPGFSFSGLDEVVAGFEELRQEPL